MIEAGPLFEVLSRRPEGRRLHVTNDAAVKSSNRKSRAARPKTSRVKVRAHRERLRAQGLRPIQIWVPDVRSPRFAAQALRQSRLVAESAYAAEDQAFIDALSSGVE
jgi:hypothetical protein